LDADPDFIKNLVSVFGLKIFKCLMKIRIRIQDLVNPGSGIRDGKSLIPDPGPGLISFESYRTYRRSCIKYVWKGERNLVQRRSYSIGRAPS
jgi:hypothetical protein